MKPQKNRTIRSSWNGSGDVWTDIAAGRQMLQMNGHKLFITIVPPTATKLRSSPVSMIVSFK